MTGIQIGQSEAEHEFVTALERVRRRAMKACLARRTKGDVEAALDALEAALVASDGAVEKMKSERPELVEKSFGGLWSGVL